VQSCEHVAARLYEDRILPKLDARGSYSSLEELVQDWAELREAYLRESAGPAQVEVLSAWLFHRMGESVKRLGAELRSSSEESHGTLLRQLEAARGALDREHSECRGPLKAEGQQPLERHDLARYLQRAEQQMQAAAEGPPPSVPPHVAAAMASHLWCRARSFVCRAVYGGPCRLINHKAGSAAPARYVLDVDFETLTVDELRTPADAGPQQLRCSCNLAALRNIWVCADSELARCAHRALQRGVADADRVLLIDVPTGPIGLVVHSPQAREEFLDGVAVLIAVRRARTEPQLARHGSLGGLRPPGLSLQSAHISGPVCAWLARAGGGEGLLPPPDSASTTQRALSEAAEALAMTGPWRRAGTWAGAA